MELFLISFGETLYQIIAGSATRLGLQASFDEFVQPGNISVLDPVFHQALHSWS